MNIIKNKEEAIKYAESYFKAYPKEKKLFVLSDGNVFLGNAVEAAKTHGAKKKVSIYEIESTDKVKSTDKSENTETKKVTPKVVSKNASEKKKINTKNNK